MLAIVLGVPELELSDERGVGRIGLLARTANGRRALDRICQDRTARGGAVRAGAPAREGDDRREHLVRCGEKSFVHPQLPATEAHHDGTIPGEPAGIEALQTEGTEAGEQLGRRSGRRCELEDELGGVGTVAAKKVTQRAKHCEAPGTKVRILSDHTEVETSMVDGESVITFTDDGRPPRDRFDTVPAVEMTVPFFVCST